MRPIPRRKKLSKLIRVQSPTRVDLAGGTLDMWPLYTFTGGALTINVAIDIWTSAEISEIKDSTEVIIESPDLGKKWKFSQFEDLLKSDDSGLHFYQCIMLQFADYFSRRVAGFHLKTSSQSPIGGGLGGSSSLTISCLKAIYSFLDIPVTDVHRLVHLAHNIEAEMLRTPTGTQDYYPAVSGGLNFLTYDYNQIHQQVQSVDKTPLAENFLLVYTGRSHHSGLNNFEVLKAAVSGDQKVLSALRQIKDIALKMQTALQKERWSELPGLFRQEYAARLQLTPAFTSPEIEKLEQICLAAGALAVKICGAGGGGCVLVWVPPERRNEVIAACQKEKFQCLPAKPVSPLKAEM